MSKISLVVNFLKHTYMLVAFVAILVIAVGSAAYYYHATKKPDSVALSPSGSDTHVISASGDVEPLQNPVLSFAALGRVARVSVSSGDRVYAGETLATLDLAALTAQKAQAIADESAAQAKLDAVTAPPRATDIAVRQLVVDQAVQARANTYAGIPPALSDAYAKAVSAVHVQSDTVFSNANSVTPTLLFNVSDSNTGADAVSARVTAGTNLSTWNGTLASLSESSSESELDAALSAAIDHLTGIRTFEDALMSALNTAIPTATFSSSSIASAQSSVSLARTTINGLITSLTATKQTLVSEALAIESAKAGLNQLMAGASSEDIAAAQASVERAKSVIVGINAQIANNIITAPFSGTVGSVSIKAGQLVAPNTPVITLLPDAGLEVVVYVTELDVASITTGEAASVTLDAFGANRVFPAHIVAVDTAPSQSPQGVLAYKVKLAFDHPESNIKTGMTANVTINAAAH